MAGDRPAWVIVGVDRPDGVMLLASTELAEAELKTEYDNYEDQIDFMLGMRMPRPPLHTLTVVMRQFVMVYADTFEEAFRKLFTQWKPESHRPAEVTGGQRALPNAGTDVILGEYRAGRAV